MCSSCKRERSFGTVNIYTQLRLPSANMLTLSFDCVPRPEHNFLPEWRDVRQNKWCSTIRSFFVPWFWYIYFHFNAPASICCCPLWFHFTVYWIYLCVNTNPQVFILHNNRKGRSNKTDQWSLPCSPGHVSSGERRGRAVWERAGLLPAGLRVSDSTTLPGAQNPQRWEILPGGAAGVQVSHGGGMESVACSFWRTKPASISKINTKKILKTESHSVYFKKKKGN